MTPSTIIKGAAADGVRLHLSSTGSVKVAGKRNAVDRWRPLIAQNKTEIVGLLKSAPVADLRAPVVKIEVISPWWRFYTDGTVKEASYSPAATRAEAMAGEPDAIAAEPFEPIPRWPDKPLNGEDEAVIRSWLAHINETDDEMIAAVMDQCRTDADARSSFIHLARLRR